ncbi:hypothetical protein ACFYUV_46865 [Nonomuraea sp. NPDC003560]|uniref:hypothetical protein n=1 Tax=Nonomuraea sp. NPDC003560 TaxID=3364341 RepID=UPI0036924F1C
MSKVSSLIDLPPSAAATALEPLTLSGKLALANGADPGEQPLVAIRLMSNGTSEYLPAVTTGADGTFTIIDIPPIGGNTQYDVRWSGNLTYEAATGLKTIAVAKRQTALTLSGPGTGNAGKQLELSGALDGGGRLPAAGTAITVTRTVSNRNGTSTTSLPSLTLSADGTFGFADTPPRAVTTPTPSNMPGTACSWPRRTRMRSRCEARPVDQRHWATWADRSSTPPGPPSGSRISRRRLRQQEQRPCPCGRAVELWGWVVRSVRR